MMSVELIGTGIRTSVLGYGTAQFGVSLREPERQRLLAAALDAGISHFDTAPLYGDGSAEESLGRFLATRRDAVTVTTKVGLLPPPGGRARRTARAAIRRLAPTVPVGAARRTRPEEPARSIEHSLRRLRTDHVDVLLVHEWRPGDLDGELQAAVEEAVARGLARAGGITAGRAFEPVGPFPQVLQSPPRIPPQGRGLIVHSVLGHELVRVQSRLEHVGVDVDVVAPLLLRLAVDSNPAGPVLFATRRPERLAAAAAAVDADDPPGLEAVREAAA